MASEGTVDSNNGGLAKVKNARYVVPRVLSKAFAHELQGWSSMIGCRAPQAMTLATSKSIKIQKIISTTNPTTS
jgi:hypothetical protein